MSATTDGLESCHPDVERARARHTRIGCDRRRHDHGRRAPRGVPPGRVHGRRDRVPHARPRPRASRSATASPPCTRRPSSSSPTRRSRSSTSRSRPTCSPRSSAPRSSSRTSRPILAQKPLALSLDEAIALRDEAAAAGKILSVNQNMRFDQSIRVLKQMLERGELGEVVFASIEMRAIPHWQTFLADYDRLTLANMSVHHLDALRFLFGEPDEIYDDRAHRPAHPVRARRTASSSRRCVSRGRARALASRTSGAGRAKRASTPTSTSSGASRAPPGSPRAPSAGRRASRRL